MDSFLFLEFLIGSGVVYLVEYDDVDFLSSSRPVEGFTSRVKSFMLLVITHGIIGTVAEPPEFCCPGPRDRFVWAELMVTSIVHCQLRLFVISGR